MIELREWVRRGLASTGFRYLVLFGTFFAIQIGLIGFHDLFLTGMSGLWLVLFFSTVFALIVAFSAVFLRYFLGLRGLDKWREGLRVGAACLTCAALYFLYGIGAKPRPPPLAVDFEGSRARLREQFSQQVNEGREASEHYELARADSIFRATGEMAKEPALSSQKELRFKLELEWAKHEYRAQRYEASLTHITEASRWGVTNADLFFMAGSLRSKLVTSRKSLERQRADAVQFFKGAFTQDPFRYDALVAYSILEAREDSKRVERELEVRSLRGLDARAYHWALAEVFAATGRPKAALSEYQKALASRSRSRFPFTGEVLLAEGKARELAGQSGRALQCYESAAASGHLREGFLRAGRLQFSMGRYFEAERILLRLVSLAPEYPGAHVLLGQVYRKLGQPDLAKRALTTALRESALAPR